MNHFPVNPPIFPASYSTLSPIALASLIEAKYSMQAVQCRFITRGVGDTYEVEWPAARYILRVYRSTHRNLPQVQAEMDLLLALKQAEVSVSYPIADASGNLIQVLQAAEGERYAVLFSYAPGQVVAQLNNAQLRSLGSQMARFHNVSSVIQLNSSRWQFNLQTTLAEPLQMLEPAFTTLPEAYAWWQQAAQRVKAQLATLNTAAFSTGYCHFDFLPKNFHFEGDAVTLFDFDFFGHGWLVNDIMTFWTHLALDVHFNRMTQGAADAAYAVFLQAYREHRPLLQDELAAVPYLGLGFWLFYMGFHTTHDMFYPLVQPASLQVRTAFIKQIMEKYWEN